MPAAVLKAPPHVPDVSRVLMDLQPGESLTFPGSGITVSVVGKSGRSARLCIVAPRSVKIDRQRLQHDTSIVG
jgi:sRNA-binding carbon storage regulator CsrA